MIADASWIAQKALAASMRDGARVRSVVIVEDGPVPGGCGNSETLAQAAMAVTGYIGDPESPKTAPRRRHRISGGSSDCRTGRPRGADQRRRRRSARFARVGRSGTGSLKTIHWAARSDPDRWTGYHVRAISRPPDRGYRVRDGRVTLDFLPDQHDCGAPYARRSVSPTLPPRLATTGFDHRHGRPYRLGAAAL